MERKHGFITTMRVTGAALLLTAAGCSLGQEQHQPKINEPKIDTPTSQPLDECKIFGNHNVVQPFNDGKYFEEEPIFYTADAVAALEAEIPGASPADFANRFVQKLVAERQIDSFQVVLDPSLELMQWQVNSEQHPYAQQAEKTALVDSLHDVIDALDDYPVGVFSKLNIKTIRIADTHTDSKVAAHYDATNGEIQVEFNKGKDGELVVSDEQANIAHEVGHAIHAMWCGNYDNADVELAGSIQFLGVSPEGLSDDEIKKIYGNIPQAELDYGPERVFPNQYSATNVQEYFATLVEFTLEERGLIQEGDADYGSVLQHNQQLVVDRMESMFPGFKNFAEKQTQLLRTAPTNEIYQNAKRIAVTKSQLEQALQTIAPGDELVLNGLVLNNNYFGSNRGAQANLFPRIQRQGADIAIWVEEWGEGSGSLISTKYTGEGYKQDFVMLMLPHTQELLLPKSIASNEPELHGFSSDKSEWSGSPADAAFIQTILREGAEPVIVELQS